MINTFGLARKPNEGTAYASIYPVYEQQTPQYPNPSPYNLAQTGYRTNELVYACINARAQAIQEAPLKLYIPDPDGDNTPELVKKHPMMELLRNPTPGVSQAEFWGIVETTLLISGFSAWEIEYNNGGQPVALWPMRSDWCSFLRGDQKPIRAIRYQPYGLPPADIDIENVVMFQYFDPLFPLLKGFSPTMAALRIISTDNEATNIVKAMLHNGGRLSGLLKTQAMLNDIESQRIRDRWRQQHAGAENAGDIAVLGSGVEWQAMSMTPQEMVFNDLDARSEARICMTYRVPPLYIAAKIGMDRSTYSNYTEAKKSFYENTIVAEWRFLASQIWEQLLPHYEENKNGYYCEFETSEVKALTEDANARHDRAIKGYVSGVLTRDESRDIIGLDPIDNSPVFAPGQPAPGGEIEEPEPETPEITSGQIASPDAVEGNNPQLTEQEIMAQTLEQKRFREFAKRRIKENKAADITSFQWKVIPKERQVELLAEFGVGRAAGGSIAKWAPFHEPGELVFKPTPAVIETSIEVKSILEAIRLGVEALKT